MNSRTVTKIIRIVPRLLMVTGGMAALVVTIAWLSGMFETKVQPGWSEDSVRRHTDQPTDVIHEVTKEYVEEAVGTLKASSRTIVAARLLATIDEIHVTAGDHVEQGQELIRLDDKELRSRLDQARQVVEAAVAMRDQAEKEYARIEELAAKQVASRSEMDRATRDLQVAKANELRATQAVSETEAQLAYTTIHAVRSGRIVDRFAEPGDIARPGEPILVLYDATSLRLEAPVMEHLAVDLKPGDTLNVYIDAVDQELEATIDEIVPQADAPSRSFLVKASLPRSENLYEGMFGRLRIPAGERRHLCLATDAVVRIGQLEFVDVVLPDETIERRLIKSGQLGFPGRQEVLSGLQAGERVILQHQSDSAEAQSVEQ